MKIPFLIHIAQAFWEWGEESNFWHPFERETNIQIEDMYDSGSQWAELTLCLPSPMPFLLDLHDMKLVNFRTAVRYNLRRIDNENFQQGEDEGGGGNQRFFVFLCLLGSIVHLGRYCSHCLDKCEILRGGGERGVSSSCTTLIKKYLESDSEWLIYRG